VNSVTLLTLLSFLTLAFVVTAECTILYVLWFIVVPGTRRTKKFFDALTMDEANELTEAGVELARERLQKRREEKAEIALLQAQAESEYIGMAPGQSYEVKP
jgi:hypothetical protein